MNKSQSWLNVLRIIFIIDQRNQELRFGIRWEGFDMVLNFALIEEYQHFYMM